jgi:hypothetical protein
MAKSYYTNGGEHLTPRSRAQIEGFLDAAKSVKHGRVSRSDAIAAWQVLSGILIEKAGSAKGALGDDDLDRVASAVDELRRRAAAQLRAEANRGTTSYAARGAKPAASPVKNARAAERTHATAARRAPSATRIEAAIEAATSKAAKKAAAEAVAQLAADERARVARAAAQRDLRVARIEEGVATVYKNAGLGDRPARLRRPGPASRPIEPEVAKAATAAMLRRFAEETTGDIAEGFRKYAEDVERGKELPAPVRAAVQRRLGLR